MAQFSAFLSRQLRRAAESTRRWKLRSSRFARYPVPQLARGSGPPRHIIVVGAGLSGLCTAYLLQRAGQRVTVLEARHRPGGRIYTLRDGFADGLHAETGAARIADTHRRTLAWVAHFRLALEPMYPDAGRLIGERDGRSVAGAETASLSSYDIHGLLTGRLPWEAQFSKLRFARLAATSLIKLNWYRIGGGMDLLPRAFADRLDGAVRYGAAVTEIRTSADGADVAFDERGTAGTVRADFVVASIPYTTLRSIRVSPALPEDKRRIIESCPHQSATRVFLQLRDRTWLAPGWSGYGVTSDRWEIWQPSFASGTQRSLLVIYAQGDPARRLAALAPGERIAKAVERVESLFPGVRERCEVAGQICWDEERWSFGAQHLGALPLDVAVRPEGRLHFAGTHTSANGWMDGALESAHRVAAEILRAT